MKIVGFLELVDKASGVVDRVSNAGKRFASGFRSASAEVEGDLSKVMRKLDEVDKKASSGLGGGLGKLGGAAAGLFAVDQVLSFGKGVFQLTAEMQKYEAVLTNTFGSQEAAKASMRDITEFASKTPFQINQLTDSYVKLANRGFVPTMQEMTKLGDLASSTAKPFDQLVEAVLDAQTGEFERLKEFGIKASKEGNKVAFAFKGQTKEVENSEAAIRAYLLSLGDVQGVSGSMDAISKTLGGQLSNVMDNFEQFQVKLGNSFAGGFSKGFEIANKVIGFFSYAVDFMETEADALKNIFKPFETAFEPIQRQLDNLEQMFFKGADAGSFLKKSFDLIGNVLLFLEPLFVSVGNSIGSLIESVVRIGKAIGEWVESSPRFQKYLAAFVKGTIGLFSGLFDYLTEGFSGIADIIEGVFSLDKVKIGQGLDKAFNFKKVGEDLGKKTAQGILDGYENGFQNKTFFSNQPAAGTSIGSAPFSRPQSQTPAPPPSTEDGLKGITGGGSRPTNIYINIDKMVEALNIYAQRIDEGSAEIETKMIKTFLRVVNSANQTYR
jgi:hypothetical protein